ncbi:MAG TPA: hypothetical protein VIG88_04260, partial [Lysobacter sp.]
LSLYLWQIVLPVPSHMTFFYDWLQPSRGLLDPWTTMPAWLLVLALLAARRRPHRTPGVRPPRPPFTGTGRGSATIAAPLNLRPSPGSASAAPPPRRPQ